MFWNPEITAPSTLGERWCRSQAPRKRQSSSSRRWNHLSRQVRPRCVVLKRTRVYIWETSTQIDPDQRNSTTKEEKLDPEAQLKAVEDTFEQAQARSLTAKLKKHPRRKTPRRWQHGRYYPMPLWWTQSTWQSSFLARHRCRVNMRRWKTEVRREARTQILAFYGVQTNHFGRWWMDIFIPSARCSKLIRS